MPFSFSSSNNLGAKWLRYWSKPFSYQDTKLFSQLAHYLKRALEPKRQNAVQQRSELKVNSVHLTRNLAVASRADYIVTGSYWEKGDQIQVLALLRHLQTGVVEASANVEFSRQIHCLAPTVSLLLSLTLSDDLRWFPLPFYKKCALSKGEKQ